MQSAEEQIKQREENEVYWIAQNLCQLEHEGRFDVIEKLFNDMKEQLNEQKLLELLDSMYSYIEEQDELQERLEQRGIINKF
jgi:type I restriction-modification system DNA methylase subunit